MLDKELRDRWIEALKSGKYQQGKGKLRYRKEDSDQFCCLGVLCDVVDPEGWKGTEGTILYFHRGMGAALGIPIPLLERIGIDAKKYADMNDHFGKSFEEIADYIESHE